MSAWRIAWDEGQIARKIWRQVAHFEGNIARIAWGIGRIKLQRLFRSQNYTWQNGKVQFSSRSDHTNHSSNTLSNLHSYLQRLTKTFRLVGSIPWQWTGPVDVLPEADKILCKWYPWNWTVTMNSRCLLLPILNTMNSRGLLLPILDTVDSWYHELQSPRITYTW